MADKPGRRSSSLIIRARHTAHALATSPPPSLQPPPRALTACHNQTQHGGMGERPRRMSSSLLACGLSTKISLPAADPGTGVRAPSIPAVGAQQAGDNRTSWQQVLIVLELLRPGQMGGAEPRPPRRETEEHGKIEGKEHLPTGLCQAHSWNFQRAPSLGGMGCMSLLEGQIREIMESIL